MVAATSTVNNTLVCFTNCKLVLEDGSIVDQDLWIDEEKGIILDAQKTFFDEGRRPDTTIDLGGDILSPGFIDIQINGAYGFDFSLFHNSDAKAYNDGLRMVARKIVETGVTSLLPTIILLEFLAPASHPNSATLLGWHAEGPFLQHEKRGAHMPGYLLNAPEGVATFESVYGTHALRSDYSGVRVITAAPEIEGVISAMAEFTRRGVIFSIGHSIASSDTAREGILAGARLITHLFNAMPQLHHRDPSIIGLLGAFESSPAYTTSATSTQFTYPSKDAAARKAESGKDGSRSHVSEAFREAETPPQTPVLHPTRPGENPSGTSPVSRAGGKSGRANEDAKQQERKPVFERPYYGIIVDGCHSHPHSVRLAYTAHSDRCILVTDAIPMLDPHLRDGVHEWRDGKRLIKEGVKVYIEGTDTLAGSVVTMDVCVRNFAKFTGCSLGQAIKCATYNPASCLNIEKRKGTLRAGADADLVLLDAAGYIKETWVGGKRVWSAAK